MQSEHDAFQQQELSGHYGHVSAQSHWDVAQSTGMAKNEAPVVDERGRLTVQIEDTTECQGCDSQKSWEPLRVDGSIVRFIQNDTVLDQIADNDATSSTCRMPAQDQEPASTVAE
jgi:hypothetical protein